MKDPTNAERSEATHEERKPQNHTMVSLEIVFTYDMNITVPPLLHFPFWGYLIDYRYFFSHQR